MDMLTLEDSSRDGQDQFRVHSLWRLRLVVSDTTANVLCPICVRVLSDPLKYL